MKRKKEKNAQKSSVSKSIYNYYTGNINLFYCILKLLMAILIPLILDV